MTEIGERLGLEHALQVPAGEPAMAPWEDVNVAGVAVGFDDGDFEVLWPAG